MDDEPNRPPSPPPPPNPAPSMEQILQRLDARSTSVGQGIHPNASSQRLGARWQITLLYGGSQRPIARLSSLERLRQAQAPAAYNQRRARLLNRQTHRDHNIEGPPPPPYSPPRNSASQGTPQMSAGPRPSDEGQGPQMTASHMPNNKGPRPNAAGPRPQPRGGTFMSRAQSSSMSGAQSSIRPAGQLAEIRREASPNEDEHLEYEVAGEWIDG